MDIKTYRVNRTDFSASGQTLSLDTREMNTVLITFSGVYAFTAQFEGSDDGGTTWFGVSAATVNTATVATAHATANATQAYEFSCHAFTDVRVRLSAFTSVGTHRVSISGTSRAVEPAPVVQVAGTIVAGAQGNASPGTTTATVNSAATVNATLVKGSAGVVYALSLNNNTAAVKYFRLYNKATAPTVGTDVPIIIIQIPASSSKEIEFGQVGMRFSAGIGYSITGAAGATDATVIAAGDVQAAINYV